MPLFISRSPSTLPSHFPADVSIHFRSSRAGLASHKSSLPRPATVPHYPTSRVFLSHLSVFLSAHRSSSLDVGLASHPRKQFIRENSDVRLTRQGSLTRLFNPGRARTMRSESNTSSIHSRFMSFTVSFFHSLTKLTCNRIDTLGTFQTVNLDAARLTLPASLGLSSPSSND